MYWVYILESLRTRRYYIGQTNNLRRRLFDHNRGKDHSSKCGGIWILIYKRDFSSRAEAVKYEKYLKSLKNKKYINNIINAG